MTAFNHRLRLLSVLPAALVISACVDTAFNPELEAIGSKSDYSGISSTDLCDAAAYFTYDAPSDGSQSAKRLLAEVLRRSDISKSDHDSALTGDVELGMSDLAATCAWGLPDEEREYYLSSGRKYTKWTYKYGEYGLDTDYLEFINDRVVSIHAGG